MTTTINCSSLNIALDQDKDSARIFILHFWKIVSLLYGAVCHLLNTQMTLDKVVRVLEMLYVKQLVILKFHYASKGKSFLHFLSS